MQTNEHDVTHGSIKSYTIGFICSILLTILPIAIVFNDWFTGLTNVAILMAIGVLQFLVQLFFFMHIREEKKPRYNLISLVFAIVILAVIVAGSMWIMMFNQVAI